MITNGAQLTNPRTTYCLSYFFDRQTTRIRFTLASRGGEHGTLDRTERTRRTTISAQPIATRSAHVADQRRQASPLAHQQLHRRTFAHIRRGDAARERAGHAARRTGYVGHRDIQNWRTELQSSAHLCGIHHISGTE